MNLEITGKVHSYEDDERTKGGQYAVKNLIVIEEDGQYPQHHKIEIAEKLWDKFGDIKKGDDVEVSCNLNGRLWIDKETGEEKGCFTSIRGWKITNNGQGAPVPTYVATDIPAPESEIDTLPF